MAVLLFRGAAVGAEEDHEGAGGEHEERVDDGGHGDAGAVEEAERDAQGEGAVLDAGLDGDGDALGAA